MHRFTAKIHKIGINPCVAVPTRISGALGRRGYVPVLATLGAEVFRATLVPVGGGRHRLCLNLLMRRAAGRDTGDTVTVMLSPDAASRVLRVPADLKSALRAAGRWKRFLAATPSRRKELIRWIRGTRNPAIRRRRVQRAVESLARPPAGR